MLGPVEEGRSGVVVSLVSPDGNRTMLSDRGVSPFLRAEELEVPWFGGCDWLHLSGYSLLRRPIEEAAAKATGSQAQGGRVSVDLATASGSPSTDRSGCCGDSSSCGPTLVFANEGELAAIGGSVPGTLVLKRGPEGFTVDGTDYAALAGRGRGHDGRGRRARRRLPRRRPRARCRGSRAVRRPARRDARD